MEKVVLTNLTGNILVFTLYHDVYCTKDTCDCIVSEVLSPSDGGLRYQQVRTPVGVYFSPNEEREFLSTVLRIPQISSLVARELVKVKKLNLQERAD